MSEMTVLKSIDLCIGFILRKKARLRLINISRKGVGYNQILERDLKKAF
jgi:hypothetical protein